MKKRVFIAVLSMFLTKIYCQEKTVSTTIWDGVAVVGYVDQGAFVNFGGPAVKVVFKPYVMTFGMLPSLKIKEDKVNPGQTKNDALTPTLGFGLGFSYKHILLQIPAFYSPKNATSNGKWNLGIGLGYKF